MFWMVEQRRGKWECQCEAGSGNKGQKMGESAKLVLEEASAWDRLECPGNGGLVTPARWGQEGPGPGPCLSPTPPLLKLWDNKAKHFSKSCSSFGEPLRDAVHGAKSREAAGAPPWRHLVLTLLSWQNSGHKEHPPPGEAGRLVSLKCLSLEDS